MAWHRPQDRTDAVLHRAEPTPDRKKTVPLRPEDVLLAAIARAVEEQAGIASSTEAAAPPVAAARPPAHRHEGDRHQAVLTDDTLAAQAQHVHSDPTLRRPILTPSRLATLCLFLSGFALASLLPLGEHRFAAEMVLKPGADRAASGKTSAASSAVLSVLTSPKSMAQTVAALQLDRDPVFTGGRPGALATALDLIAPAGTASDPVSRAEAALKSSVVASADPTTGSVRLRVTTPDPDRSSAIADHLTKLALGSSASATAAGPSAMRAQADAELAAFSAKNGAEKVKVALNLDAQIKQVEGEIGLSDQRLAETRDRAERLKAAKAAEALAGKLPQDLLSPALDEKLQRYGLAKAALAEMSADLGPRHPRYLARQAELDSLRDQAGAELVRLAKSAVADISQAREARMALDKQRNLLLAQARDTGVDLAELSTLASKLAAARNGLDDSITTASIPEEPAALLQAGPQRILTLEDGPGPVYRLLLGGLIGGLLSLASLYMFRSEEDRSSPAPIT